MSSNTSSTVHVLHLCLHALSSRQLAYVYIASYIEVYYHMQREIIPITTERSALNQVILSSCSSANHPENVNPFIRSSSEKLATLFIRFCDKRKQEKFAEYSVMNSVMCAMSNLFSTAHTISCQVYPLEYAYWNSSVTRAESASTKCRNYPAGSLQIGIQPEDYIHCDGTQL